MFISNGPGDPVMCDKTIKNIRSIVNDPNCKPLFGICLGHQLLSLAIGAKTFKMKYVLYVPVLKMCLVGVFVFLIFHDHYTFMFHEMLTVFFCYRRSSDCLMSLTLSGPLSVF